MPQFEVFIPPLDPAGSNLTLTVEAADWLEALCSGLANIGEDVQLVSRVICDLQSDGSVHGVDLESGRVFRLLEMATEAEIVSSRDAVAPAPAGRGERFESAPQPIARVTSRPLPTDPQLRLPRPAIDLDQVLGELFERIQELYCEHPDRDSVVGTLLDLALEKVPADAGTFYLADISSHDLLFASVRGPRSVEILHSGLRVPIGHGVAGFCAQEGVAMAIGDAQRDPRFAREIGDKIGYAAHSMACAPLDKGGRCFGVLQLINRVGATCFSAADLDILVAIARQGVELLALIDA
ncbi:MAG: GAF domain-containing protein [Deltaproteobacteria bacterium]|nr:GAF domain-containing protein [Deltaproteobacteria bacterium]